MFREVLTTHTKVIEQYNPPRAGLGFGWQKYIVSDVIIWESGSQPLLREPQGLPEFQMGIR